jgi:ethanolamine utilization protein EutN
MILARVSGTVVMTVKHPRYQAEKVMCVEAIDENGNPTGQSWVAVDRAQAGVGDTVLVLREGNGIRQIVGRDEGIPVDKAVLADVPIRSLIVGIVDEVAT